MVKTCLYYKYGTRIDLETRGNVHTISCNRAIIEMIKRNIETYVYVETIW